MLTAALLRLFVFKLDETPKYLVSNGNDEEAVRVLQKIAEKYNRPMSLTVEDLKDCGEIDKSLVIQEGNMTWKLVWVATKHHVKILFQTKLVTYSTTLILASWALIGMAYLTFFNFLYIYISLHGGNTGTSTYITYRNSTIAYFVGIFGPMMGGYMCRWPRLGRRGTMCVSGFASMAILFGYTTVRTQEGDVGFASATYFVVNIYYGALYAYTPEVFPALARTTGGALALVFGRATGLLAPVVYYFGQKSGSSVPIWVCGACFGVLGILAAIAPFEPTKQRSV